MNFKRNLIILISVFISILFLLNLSSSVFATHAEQLFLNSNQTGLTINRFEIDPITLNDNPVNDLKNLSFSVNIGNNLNNISEDIYVTAVIIPQNTKYYNSGRKKNFLKNIGKKLSSLDKVNNFKIPGNLEKYSDSDFYYTIFKINKNDVKGINFKSGSNYDASLTLNIDVDKLDEFKFAKFYIFANTYKRGVESGSVHESSLTNMMPALLSSNHYPIDGFYLNPGKGMLELYIDNDNKCISNTYHNCYNIENIEEDYKEVFYYTTWDTSSHIKLKSKYTFIGPNIEAGYKSIDLINEKYNVLFSTVTKNLFNDNFNFTMNKSSNIERYFDIDNIDFDLSNSYVKIDYSDFTNKFRFARPQYAAFLIMFVNEELADEFIDTFATQVMWGEHYFKFLVDNPKKFKELQIDKVFFDKVKSKYYDLTYTLGLKDYFRNEDPAANIINDTINLPLDENTIYNFKNNKINKIYVYGVRYNSYMGVNNRRVDSKSMTSAGHGNAFAKNNQETVKLLFSGIAKKDVSQTVKTSGQTGSAVIQPVLNLSDDLYIDILDETIISNNIEHRLKDSTNVRFRVLGAGDSNVNIFKCTEPIENNVHFDRGEDLSHLLNNNICDKITIDNTKLIGDLVFNFGINELPIYIYAYKFDKTAPYDLIINFKDPNGAAVKNNIPKNPFDKSIYNNYSTDYVVLYPKVKPLSIKSIDYNVLENVVDVDFYLNKLISGFKIYNYSSPIILNSIYNYSSANKDILKIVDDVGNAYLMSENEKAMFKSIILTTSNNNFSQVCLADGLNNCRYKGLAAIDSDVWVKFSDDLYDGTFTDINGTISVAFRNFKEKLAKGNFTTINNLDGIENGFGLNDSKIDTKNEYLQLIKLIEDTNITSNTLQQKYASIILSGAIFLANEANVILDSQSSGDASKLTYPLFVNNTNEINSNLLNIMFISGYKFKTNGDTKFTNGIKTYSDTELESETAEFVKKELMWYLSYQKNRLENLAVDPNNDATAITSKQKSKKATFNYKTHLVNLNKPFNPTTESIRSPVSIELDGFDNDSDPVYMFVASSKSNTAKNNIYKYLTKPVQPINFNKAINSIITKQSLLVGDVFYKVDRSNFKENKLDLEIENTIDGILIAFYKYSDFAGNKAKADYYPTRTKEEYETIDNPELIKGKNYEFTYSFIINECKEDACKFSDYNIKQKILNFYSKDHSLIFPHPYISKDLTDLLGDLRSVDPNTYYLFNSSSGPVVISMEEFLRQRDTFTSVLLRDISNLSVDINERNERINKLLDDVLDLTSHNIDLDAKILVLKGNISFLEDSVASKISKIKSLDLEILNGTLKISDLEEKVEELEANNENLIISLCLLDGLNAADYVTDDGFDYTKFFEDFDELREAYNVQKMELTAENEDLKAKISELKSDKSELKNVLERLLYTPVTPIESLSGDGAESVTYLLNNEINKLDKLKIFFKDNVDFIKIIDERIIFINKLISQITNDKITRLQLIDSLTAENDTLKLDLNLKVEELFKRNVDILELQKKIRNTDDDAVLSDSLDIIISFKKLIDEGQIAEKIIKIEEIITDIKDDADESEKAQKIMKIKGILDDIDGADYTEKMDNLQKMLDNINFFTDFIDQEGIILDGSNPEIDIINLNTLKSYSDILARIYNFSFDESSDLDSESYFNPNSFIFPVDLSSNTNNFSDDFINRLSSNLLSANGVEPRIVVQNISNTPSDMIVVVTDCDSYISNLIDGFEMRTDLSFSKIPKWKIVDESLLNILDDVATTFSLSDEEKAQYYAIMVQESGNSADRIGSIENTSKENCTGGNLIYNDSTKKCENKSHLGIAQISKSVWIFKDGHYLDSEFDKPIMLDVFLAKDFGTINTKISSHFGGDNGCIGTKDQYKFLLEKVNSISDIIYVANLTNEQRYASAIFGAVLFLRNKELIVSNQQNNTSKKIAENMFSIYNPKTEENNESLDIMFASGYKYYRTSQNFKYGIKEYKGNDGTGDNLLAAATESARQKSLWYLAYKKEMCLATQVVSEPESIESSSATLQDEIVEKALKFMDEKKCYADVSDHIEFNCTGFQWQVLNEIVNDNLNYGSSDEISKLRNVLLNKAKGYSTYYGPYVAASLGGSYFIIDADSTDYSKLEKGDLLYFADFTHAGIYIGNYTSNVKSYVNAVIHSGRDNDKQSVADSLACKAKNGPTYTSIVNVDGIEDIRTNLKTSYSGTKQYLFVLRLSDKINFVQNNFDKINKLSGTNAVNELKEVLDETSDTGSTIQCPVGYVLVPGNQDVYGTDDFCVMKFEAKVDQDGDGVGDSNSSCQFKSYHVWNNSASGCSYTELGRSIVSTMIGYPLGYINWTEAKTVCESVGAHLITNDEWMTIARDIESQPENWSTGIVGLGYIPRGNSNGSYALDDDTVLSGINKRNLVLSNGNEIYDLAGNVSEWVDKTIQRKDMPPVSIGLMEYTSISDYGLEGRDAYNFDGTDYDSTNGIGKLYNYYLAGSTDEKVFLRGGDWYYGTNAGLLYLILLIDSVYQDYSNGFRCSVVP